LHRFEPALTSERMRSFVFPAATVVLLLAACASPEVKPLGPTRPARATGCQVEFFAGSTPSYAYVDIASVQARCRYSAGRSGCLDDLRTKACALGGDTVYGVAKGMTRDYTLVQATIAYRSSASYAEASPSAPCSPACGPGFICADEECIPDCSPRCGSGETCNAMRVCVPSRPSANAPQ
jgi:hypothetical protein